MRVDFIVVNGLQKQGFNQIPDLLSLSFCNKKNVTKAIAFITF